MSQPLNDGRDPLVKSGRHELSEVTVEAYVDPWTRSRRDRRFGYRGPCSRIGHCAEP